MLNLHIFALVWLPVTWLYIFLRWHVTQLFHVFTHAEVFEVVFLAQIREDYCLQDTE